MSPRDTQPVSPVRHATCDRCGALDLCRTVNDACARWCLVCIALPPEPRELVMPEPPREVARGTR